MAANSTVRRMSRVQKAERLVAFGHVPPAGGRHRYLVDSDTPGKQYRVEFGPNTVYCSCLDWARQYEATHQADSWCKHAGAAVLYRQAIRDSWRPHAPSAVVA